MFSVLPHLTQTALFVSCRVSRRARFYCWESRAQPQMLLLLVVQVFSQGSVTFHQLLRLRRTGHQRR